MSAVSEDFRDFDAENADAEREPIEFALGGRRLRTFRPLSGGPYLRLCRALSVASGSVDQQVAWEAFILDVLADDDGPDPEHPSKDSSRDRFLDAYAASGLPTDGIYDIGGWIIGRATARPTEPPSPSEPGSSDSGEPSKVVSLSPAPASDSET